MTDEITEPTLKLCWNGHAIRRAAEVLRAAHLDLMAEDVEAQIPKPAVEEPLEFASVVKVKSEQLFVRISATARYPWVSGPEERDWSDLHDVEVLRVGVGEPGKSSDFEDGLREMNTQARGCIVALHGTTPLVVEQRAYEKAIKAVEGLAP